MELHKNESREGTRNIHNNGLLLCGKNDCELKVKLALNLHNKTNLYFSKDSKYSNTSH